MAQILEAQVPTGAFNYCLQLWQETPFHLVLRKSRRSKLGDFTCPPGRIPRITVNGDSHPYLFLITYVHEVAHFRVHSRFGFKVNPHGKEWKEAFRDLCIPLLEQDVFPEKIAEVLRDHLRNPAATSLTDIRLSRVLQEHDERWVGMLRLVDLPEGSEFQLHGRWFQKGKLKRTRVMCRELSSRRTYLITAHALIGNS